MNSPVENCKRIKLPLGRKVNGNIHWLPLYDLPHLLIYFEQGNQHLLFERFILNHLMDGLQVRKLFQDKILKIDAEQQLSFWINEMDLRYDILNTFERRNIYEYNEQARNPFPIYLLVIPLLEQQYLKRDIVYSISRIAQLSRCIGIHLLVQVNHFIFDELHYLEILKAPLSSCLCGQTKSIAQSQLMIDDDSAYTIAQPSEYIWSHYTEPYLWHFFQE